MASSLQSNGFMYKIIHRSLIERLLCARPNIKGWDREMQETFCTRKKKKTTLKLLNKFALKTFTMEVLHFRRVPDGLRGKGERKAASPTWHGDCSPSVRAPTYGSPLQSVWSKHAADTQEMSPLLKNKFISSPPCRSTKAWLGISGTQADNGERGRKRSDPWKGSHWQINIPGQN